MILRRLARQEGGELVDKIKGDAGRDDGAGQGAEESSNAVCRTTKGLSRKCAAPSISLSSGPPLHLMSGSPPIRYDPESGAVSTLSMILQTFLFATAVSIAAAGARAGRGAVHSTHALRLWVPGLVASPPKSLGGSRGVHRRCQSSALARNLDFAAGRRSVPCGVRRRSRARERADGARPRAGGGGPGGA